MPKTSHPAQDDERDLLKSPPLDAGLDQVRDAIRGIRFGEVRVIIQDATIVQIDRLEKRRLC